MPNTFVKIASVTVGAGGTGNVAFSSIPQTGYNNLLVKISARSSWTGSTTDSLGLYINGVQTNRNRILLYANGSNVLSNSSTYRDVGATPAGLATASTFSNVEIYIPNYISSINKSFSSDFAMENNAAPCDMGMTAGLWSSTAAITDLGFDCSTSGLNFVQYSTFTLYGIKNS